jgi:hypothetical protein
MAKNSETDNYRDEALKAILAHDNMSTVVSATQLADRLAWLATKIVEELTPGTAYQSYMNLSAITRRLHITHYRAKDIVSRYKVRVRPRGALTLYHIDDVKKYLAAESN